MDEIRIALDTNYEEGIRQVYLNLCEDIQTQFVITRRRSHKKGPLSATQARRYSKLTGRERYHIIRAGSLEDASYLVQYGHYTGRGPHSDYHINYHITTIIKTTSVV